MFVVNLIVVESASPLFNSSLNKPQPQTTNDNYPNEWVVLYSTTKLFAWVFANLWTKSKDKCHPLKNTLHFFDSYERWVDEIIFEPALPIAKILTNRI